jgi:hypothetical protein
MKWAPVLAALLCLPGTVLGQQYRLRLNSQFQSVSFRGVELDSIPAASVMVGPGGGLQSPDGIAVRCGIGDLYCFLFRPGVIRTARPVVTSAAGTVWGFGIPGVSLRGDARLAMDLGDTEVWPGTSPALQLLEGYAEYAGERLTGRLGRQMATSRLGFTGFDGARLTARVLDRRLELDGYLGWGLARASALPVTSPALNPLDDFQPRLRQLVAGLGAGWSHDRGDLRVNYQREVDTRSDYFVSERLAVGASVRVADGFTLNAGSEYDLAMAQWGTADALLTHVARRWSAAAGVLRYRPHFDLWTIWGAFSPQGYTALNGSLLVRPITGLRVTARGSRFWYDDTDTQTPLVDVADRGWRLSLAGSYSPLPSLAFDLEHTTEFGPGASSASIDGSVSYFPRRDMTFSLHGGRLHRPLEFRLSEATLYLIALDAAWQISDRWHGSVRVSRSMEERDRPDAAAFDWNQTRLSASLSVYLGWEAGQQPLPRARRNAGVSGE